jgi:hypothetical protein
VDTNGKQSIENEVPLKGASAGRGRKLPIIVVKTLKDSNK